MAKKHELEITEQPNGKLAPKTGRRTTVKKGDTVVFSAERGAGPPMDIDFRGRSPFGEKVEYMKTVAVTADHVPNGDNVYPYDCSFRKNGIDMSSEGGGDIEILSSDG